MKTKNWENAETIYDFSKVKELNNLRPKYVKFVGLIIRDDRRNFKSNVGF